jgi:hypothetical protein
VANIIPFVSPNPPLDVVGAAIVYLEEVEITSTSAVCINALTDAVV